jgi:hypothetical protein
MPCKGRSTCASVSAFSLDAQPAQLERVVRRICLPEGAFWDGLVFSGSTVISHQYD